MERERVRQQVNWVLIKERKTQVHGRHIYGWMDGWMGGGLGNGVYLSVGFSLRGLVQYPVSLSVVGVKGLLVYLNISCVPQRPKWV